ncbi:DUF2062 domain-containing protein [uncultured Thiodictyon sp.]|uniref:DUF2062 domain-containing protein n=1 Tax=uncultured Thiodictyon sp. TaxID=1846217 RepID=UPI0025D0D9AB|nr:DUF2062 domain-containing protein [uncultured Thiodictyon sp.]
MNKPLKAKNRLARITQMNLRRLLKRIMPHPSMILDNRYMSVFGKRIHDPNLWHLNRRSASGAVAVACFICYLPPVGHMFTAAALSMLFRVNLPLAVAMVWISNPVTIPPMFYFAYAVGSWMMGVAPKGFDLEFWTTPHNWLAVLTPLGLGMTVCAFSFAAVGYYGTQALWRWSLRREIAQRRERYLEMRTQEMAAALASESVVSTPSSSRQT